MLEEIRIVESDVLQVGTLVAGDRFVAMHPLDLIWIRSRSIDERLEIAMRWIVDQALSRLARLERTLCEPEDRDFHVEDPDTTAGDFSALCYCGREWICPFWGDQLGHERAPFEWWAD